MVGQDGKKAASSGMEVVLHNGRGGPDNEEDGGSPLSVERTNRDAATCRWQIAPFSKVHIA